jgi:hypothetical protein
MAGGRKWPLHGALAFGRFYPPAFRNDMRPVRQRRFPCNGQAHPPPSPSRKGKLFVESSFSGRPGGNQGGPAAFIDKFPKQRAQAMSLFHEPVKLLHGDDSRLIEVCDAGQAAMALENGWPEARGKWYWAARQACRAAGEGRASPHVARRIFLRAVEESRQPQLPA